MRMHKDYHKTLGVSKGASKDEIRRAYRKLALLYHPDRNPSPLAESRFKEINEAYRVLSGLEKPRPEAAAGGKDAEAWAATVINIWREMASRRHDNAYR